jgi:hypothetical protein
MKITETDALTHETIEREPTTEELAQFALDAKANKSQAAIAKSKAAAKASAIAKLEALGLNLEEAQAIFG